MLILLVLVMHNISEEATEKDEIKRRILNIKKSFLFWSVEGGSPVAHKIDKCTYS